ncbi:MAG: GGDEF domain-containing protein [Steroidobacteraceae bacterium]
MSALPSTRRGAAQCCAILLVLGFCAASASRTAHAGCFDITDPEFVQLRPLIDRNDAEALAEVNARLAALPADAARTEPRRLAVLYALQADAYGGLSLNPQTQSAAVKGLALLHEPIDPLRLELLSTYGSSFNEPTGIDRVLVLMEQARARLPVGSRSDLCLAINEGAMNYLRGRTDLAVRELTQAYLQSASPSLIEAHIQAAANLARVLGAVGDFEEALALMKQASQWDASHGFSADLTNDLYFQGKILVKMRHFHQAVAALERQRSISVSVGDLQGVAYADLRICESEIGLGQFAAGRRHCDRAEPVLAEGGAFDEVKETHSLLARIDLAESQPARALVLLNVVLDHDGKDMLARDVAPAYLARREANAALHQYRSAYRDGQEYLRRYTPQNRAERVRLKEALEVRFDAKQEIERNAVLRRKLLAAAQRLHWIEVASAAGTLVIALLSYILITDKRHRRQLLRLANEDNLTGAPNRRHAAQLAAAAVRTALDTGRPLTVALLDFDHFKDINDRCGHAAGDHVLKEFTRLARDALRANDILGRWGGEEFLLVLPGTTLDSAFSSVERLRQLALSIQLRVNEGPHVTFSAGLATTADGACTLDEIVAHADAALYEAKNAGRDLVRIDRESLQNASTDVRRALSSAVMG